MKIITLLVFLFLLTTCGYVDEDEIEVDTKIWIDVFLDRSYEIEDINSFNQTWAILLWLSVTNTGTTANTNSDTVIKNNLVSDETEAADLILHDKIDENSIQAIKDDIKNITISTESIDSVDNLSSDNIVIEETTSEDIEELINLLFQSNN